MIDNRDDFINIVMIIAASFLGLGLGKIVSTMLISGAYAPWFITYVLILCSAEYLFNRYRRGVKYEQQDKKGRL